MPEVPRCIGVILDGNRRYAKERGLPSLEGHRLGFERVKDIVAWATEAGVRDIALYAFSTENWDRDPQEVAYLMSLYEAFADEWAGAIRAKGGRIRFIGQLERFGESLQAKMRHAEESTREGTGITAWVCLSYGGRAEILDAVNRLMKEGAPGPVDEAMLRARMWSAKMPDPDLIIRTSGEQRLSGFLTWQSTYSELAFLSPQLPALTRQDFDAALADYAARHRRRGR